MTTESNLDGVKTVERAESNDKHFLIALGRMLAVPFAFVLFYLGNQRLNAAPPEIVCSVSEEEVFLGESMTFQVDVQNTENPIAPNLSVLNEQFEVEFIGEQSRNQTTAMFSGGRISQSNILSHVYQYRLTPKLTGDIEIPAVTATIDGKNRTSNKVAVRILEIPKQDTVVAEILLSQTKVYPTQSFSAKLRVLVKPIADAIPDPLQPLRRSPPQLQINWLKPAKGLKSNESNEWLQPLLSKNNVGFTINEVNLQSGSLFDRERLAVFGLLNGRETLNGLDGEPIEYFTYELNRKFVAEKVGTYTFGPAMVKGTFVTSLTGRQYDTERIVAIATPVSIEVLEVPSPRPNNFTGGIGSYSVSASATPNKLRVGDPLTLTLQFAQGKNSGSLELISAPDLNAVPEIADQFEIVDKSPVGRLEGDTKNFAYGLRAKRAGVSIPALSLSTFDPNSENFSVVTTDPIAIEVSEASSLAGGDLFGSIDTSKPVADIKTRAEGIFHNITDVTQVRNERSDLVKGLKWVAGLWLCTGIAIGSLLTFRRQSSDVERQRRVSARRIAQSRLTAANALATQGKHSESLREVRAAILGLVADTGNQIADGLTTADVNAAMSAAKVPIEDQARLQKLLERIESAEYGAADTTDTTLILKDSLKLVDRVSPFLERKSAK